MSYSKMSSKIESNNYKNSIKAVIWGLLAGSIVCTAFLFLFSLVFLKIKSVPFSMVNTLATICAAFGAFVSGYITVRIYRKNGFLYGATAGFVLFLILTVIGFIVSRDKFTYLTLVKFIVLTLMGAIGGVFGVNKRSR